MATTVQELLKLKEEYIAKVRQEGEGVVKGLFRDFFRNNPGVESIRWSQYTPYFNDGDPCEFRVNDARVKFVDAATARANLRPEKLEEAQYRTERDHGSYTSRYVKTGSRPLTDDEILEGGDYEDGYYEAYSLNDNALSDALDQLNTLMEKSQDILEMVFGDHVEVTANPNSIETEEYEHD